MRISDWSSDVCSSDLSDRASASLVSDVVLRKALAMLGTDYEFGSNDADAVDCSALVQQAFRSAGLELPRTVRELLRSGVNVKRSQLRAGDLMIYRWKPRSEEHTSELQSLMRISYAVF